MSDMVERVGAAIYGAAHDDFGVEVTLPRLVCDQIARAAIAAMREPTEAMVAAGEGAQTLEVPDVWRTMIDKALEKPLKGAPGINPL